MTVEVEFFPLKPVLYRQINIDYYDIAKEKYGDDCEINEYILVKLDYNKDIDYYHIYYLKKTENGFLEGYMKSSIYIKFWKYE